MPEPSASDEQRLDEVFDPSRLRRDAEHDQAARTKPWEHPGVVMDDAASRGSKWREPPTTIGLVLAAVFAVCGVTLVVAGVLGGASSPMFQQFGVLLLWAAVPLGLQAWLVTSALRAGRMHPPNWGWLLVALALAGGLVLIVTGWISAQFSVAMGMLVFPLAGGMLTPLQPRRGSELRCAACQFEYAYTAPDSRPAPEVCSECGTAWHSRNGLVRGLPARSRYVLLVIVMASTMAISVSLGPLSGLLIGVMPNGSLIGTVTAPNAGFVIDEWKELSTRTLSSDQRLRLARGLLDLRLEEQSLPAEADAWLDAEIVAGRLPPEIVDRYHREMFDATLYGPQRVRVWETAVFGLDTLERGYPFAPRDAYLAIRGFSSDDDPATLRATQNTLLYGSLAGGRSAWLGVQTARPGGVEAPFTFETPGTRRITCVYWLVVLPQNTPAGPITWNADGTPNLPPGTLFSERREVWAEVEVTP